MQKLSNIKNKPSSKEIQIFKTCEATGLPKSIVTKMFESSDDFTKEITDITKPKEIITSEQFKTSIATVFSELSTKENLNKGDLTSKFLDIFYDISQTKIDSVNLLTIVQDIFALKDLKNLNEEQKNLAIIYDEPVMLFEGLKTILEKNNPKWGMTYHLDNVYQTIMRELTKEVEQLQLNRKMHSSNNDFHLMIINDFMSGNCSPINMNVSAVKELIPDLQTLVFDLSLIIARYIISEQDALKYVARQTYNEYIEAGNGIISTMYSSTGSSLLLNCGNDSVELISGDDKNLIEKFAWQISDKNLKYPLHNQSIKGVYDMIKFIMSCSTELGLNLRPYVRLYNTKALYLMDNVEHAKMLLNNGYIRS